jgi:hypothetical protein
VGHRAQRLVGRGVEHRFVLAALVCLLREPHAPQGHHILGVVPRARSQHALLFHQFRQPVRRALLTAEAARLLERRTRRLVVHGEEIIVEAEARHADQRSGWEHGLKLGRKLA